MQQKCWGLWARTGWGGRAEFYSRIVHVVVVHIKVVRSDISFCYVLTGLVLICYLIISMLVLVPFGHNTVNFLEPNPELASAGVVLAPLAMGFTKVL